ncbi:MAG: sensor histidine kinase [Planctomycetota bacterium]|nr:MAG: sensor histidine kinase [Planctomycetota bacterium]
MTLARRIWWLVVALALGAALVTGSAGWWAARTLLLAEVDTALHNEAQRMVGITASGSPRLLRLQRREGVEWRMLSKDGAELRASEHWPEGLQLEALAAESVRAIEAQQRHWRVVQYAFPPLPAQDEEVDPPRALGPDGQRLWQRRRGQIRRLQESLQGTHLQVAVDVTQLHHDLGRLAVLLLLVAVLVGGAAVLVAGRLRDAVLAPLARLAAAVGRLDDQDPAARLQVEALPLELEHLRQRLDDLLARLGEGRKRERRTLADIAHELRTPLAALRSELDFAAASSTAVDAGLRTRLSAQTAMLQCRFEGLLLLNRLDGDPQPLAQRPQSLVDALAAAWAPLAQRAEAAGWELVVDDEADVELSAEPTLLGMLLSNILGNALDHGQGPGQIRLLLLPPQAGRARLQISNPCPPSPPGPLPAACEAFWRGDVMRSQSANHAGLGLAVVSRIAAAHGATVAVAISADGRHFELHLTWPLVAQAAPSTES